MKSNAFWRFTRAKTTDTTRGDDGAFQSPSNVLLETLSVVHATTVGELARTTGISEATIVEHLNRLQTQALVEERGGGWTLADESSRVDQAVERRRRNSEEAADWEYEDDESIY
ncbi:ArsR family transcriptional regulator [Halobacterium salinarum]|uniref:Putative ArsR family transcriptional regulator n=1 Tax=Halobacterium salinarum TaxID=2242 RepID=A0A841HFI6_HALSI|nr:ArsR family transcriptional regulator [Halobacterium salinarum]MBB6090855.1 putative ArsR family transcriptional regulator [Halobacterium salinarum]MDL0128503.1 ArsR family transcriptional regulator [Halobacterium salinarum]